MKPTINVQISGGKLMNCNENAQRSTYCTWEEDESSESHPKGDILAEIQLTLNVIQYFNHSESSMKLAVPVTNMFFAICLK